MVYVYQKFLNKMITKMFVSVYPMILNNFRARKKGFIAFHRFFPKKLEKVNGPPFGSIFSKKYFR